MLFRSVALGWPQASHVGGRRRSDSGDQNSGGPSPELAGIALRGSGRSGARPIQKGSQRRIQGGRGFAGLGRNRRRRAAEAAARTGARRKRGYGGLSSKRRGWGASTRGGECNGLEPVTIRSPETRRRRAPRRGVRARAGKKLGGARERKDRGGGGKRLTARHTEAGESLGAAGRRRGRRGSPASEVEHELGEAVEVAPSFNGEAEVV